MVFDPRVGLALLVFANLAAFSEQPFWMEMIWIGFLLLLMLLHRCFAMAGKSLLIFGGILCLQYWILPAAPGWAATSFSIFANYARRMMPCLMIGFLTSCPSSLESRLYFPHFQIFLPFSANVLLED